MNDTPTPIRHESPGGPYWYHPDHPDCQDGQVLWEEPSDTPLTDAAILPEGEYKGHLVWADDAYKIERMLNAAQAANAELEKERDEAKAEAALANRMLEREKLTCASLRRELEDPPADVQELVLKKLSVNERIAELAQERDKARAHAEALAGALEQIKGNCEMCSADAYVGKLCKELAVLCRRYLAAFRADQPGGRGDGERINWLEQTVLGTGKSRFLKSIFLCHNMHEDGIHMDVKTQGVTSAPTLRAAIDAAIDAATGKEQTQSHPFMNCPKCGEFRGHGHVCAALGKEGE